MYIIIHDKDTYEMIAEIEGDFDIKAVKSVRIPTSMSASWVGKPIYNYDCNGKAYLINHSVVEQQEGDEDA